MSILDGADVLADYFVPSYTAGEAISAGDAVALDLSDNKIYKASASAWAYRINFIGFAIAGGLSGATIPVNDTPIVAEKTGLTAGSMYYLSNTQGAIATSSGTIESRIGLATTATRIKRPKNGTPVSAYISRALSSSTAYTHLIATMTSQGGSTRTLTVNSTTIENDASNDRMGFMITVLPDDVVTWSYGNSVGGGIGSNALVQILDR